MTHLEGVCFGVIHVLIDATAVDLPRSFVRVNQVTMIRGISTFPNLVSDEQDSPILQDLGEEEAVLEILEGTAILGVHVRDFRET